MKWNLLQTQKFTAFLNLTSICIFFYRYTFLRQGNKPRDLNTGFIWLAKAMMVLFTFVIVSSNRFSVRE